MSSWRLPEQSGYTFQFYFAGLISSQLWLIPLVNDLQGVCQTVALPFTLKIKFNVFIIFIFSLIHCQFPTYTSKVK
jgi:hypothetical protein